MNAEETLEFIEDYRSYPCLWDINDRTYTNKNKRNDAYIALSTKYGITAKAIRNKIKSLRSYFSKEHQKMLEMKSGAGTEDTYETTWFAYRALLFIADSLTPRQTRDSLAPGFSVRQAITNNETNSDDGDNVERIVDECEIDLASVEDDRRPTDASKSTNFRNQPSPSTSGTQTVKTARNIKRVREEEARVEEEAVKLLKTASEKIANRDECSIFGDFIASQIRKLNRRNQAIARNQIQTLLFKLEMEELENENEVLNFEIPSPQPSVNQLNASISTTSSTGQEINEEVKKFLILNIKKK